MNSFPVIAAIKSLLWIAAFLSLIRMLPARARRTRRTLALIGVWGLSIVPWVSLSSAFSVLAVPATSRAGAISWSWFGVAIWSVGFTMGLLRLFRESQVWRRIITRSTKYHDICLSEEVDGPCLVGVWKPVVLMPRSALGWPAAQWHCALRHERQHALQHDGLHRLAAAFASALWWWNPLAHKLCRRLEIESEIACDRAAVQDGDAGAYGRMLLALASTPAGGAIAWAARHSLRERIERLLASDAEGEEPLLPAIGAIFAAALAAGIVLSIHHTATQALHEDAAIRLSADPFPAESSVR